MLSFIVYCNNYNNNGTVLGAMPLPKQIKTSALANQSAPTTQTTKYGRLLQSGSPQAFLVNQIEGYQERGDHTLLTEDPTQIDSILQWKGPQVLSLRFFHDRLHSYPLLIILCTTRIPQIPVKRAILHLLHQRWTLIRDKECTDTEIEEIMWVF